MCPQCSPQRERLALPTPRPFCLLRTRLLDFIILPHQQLEALKHRHQFVRDTKEINTVVHGIEDIASCGVVEGAFELPKHGYDAFEIARGMLDVLTSILDFGNEGLSLYCEFSTKYNKRRDSAGAGYAVHGGWTC